MTSTGAGLAPDDGGGDAVSRATAADDVVRAAYTDRAEEYTALLGSVAAMDALDVRLIGEWAAGCDGLVVDVGCGPGHWTHLLAERGVQAEGVDLVPAFVELARARFPTVPYRVGRLDDLGLPDASAAGILAWYSLIHLPPDRVPAVLRELCRCLRADGTLLVGFFTGDGVEPFDHTVTTAFSWPVDELARVVEDAGFTVRASGTRANPRRPDRGHGWLLASRA